MGISHQHNILFFWTASNTVSQPLCSSLIETAKPSPLVPAESTIELNQLNMVSWRGVIFCYLHHIISLTNHSQLPFFSFKWPLSVSSHLLLFRAPERFVWLMIAAEDPTVESSSTGGESSLGLLTVVRSLTSTL